MAKANLLTWSLTPVSRSAVRAQYWKWRADHLIPVRCDEEDCVFYSQPLVWNGKILPVIIDHRNGNIQDNRPENLRCLCPNCDSQQIETRGGANRGRVKNLEQSFTVKRASGANEYYFFPEGGITFGGEATVEFVPGTGQPDAAVSDSQS